MQNLLQNCLNMVYFGGVKCDRFEAVIEVMNTLFNNLINLEFQITNNFGIFNSFRRTQKPIIQRK